VCNMQKCWTNWVWISSTGPLTEPPLVWTTLRWPLLGRAAWLPSPSAPPLPPNMEESNPPGAGRSSSPPPPPSLRFRRPLWRSARPPCSGYGSSPRRSWPPSRPTQTSRSMPPSGALLCGQGTRSVGLQQPTGGWECRRYVSGGGAYHVLLSVPF
jgi:hypothetical protein